MKYQKYIIIFRNKFLHLCLIIFLLASNSCSDFLEVNPVEDISIKEQLSNKTDLLEALNGSYYQFRELYATESFYLYGDYQAGNISFTPYALGTNKGIVDVGKFDNVYNFDDLKTESKFSSFYANAYSLINSVNLILEFVDALPDATEDEKDQIKAECLSLRAITHFHLARLYSQNYTYTSDASHLGIVYNTKRLKVGYDYPARLSCKETFALILEDLNTALGLFKTNQALSSGKSYTYFNKISTKTLLADVYLWMNNWQKAYELSDDIIKNSGISLTSKANYVTEWKSDNSLSESIFVFPLRSGDDKSAYDGYMGYTNASTYSSYAISGDILTQFDATDIRKKDLTFTQNLQVKNGAVYVATPYAFSYKFSGLPEGFLYRMSEVYLIRAEAAARVNNFSQAQNDLNTIRSRSDITPILTSTNWVEDILTEKRKEFVFENKTFYDMARTHKNVSRNLGCTGIGTMCSLTYPNNKYILPIPQNSIDVNVNMKQNDGY